MRASWVPRSTETHGHVLDPVLMGPGAWWLHPQAWVCEEAWVCEDFVYS